MTVKMFILPLLNAVCAAVICASDEPGLFVCSRPISKCLSYLGLGQVHDSLGCRGFEVGWLSCWISLGLVALVLRLLSLHPNLTPARGCEERARAPSELRGWALDPRGRNNSAEAKRLQRSCVLLPLLLYWSRPSGAVASPWVFDACRPRGTKSLRRHTAVPAEPPQRTEPSSGGSVCAIVVTAILWPSRRS